jgi:hypothetical protein
MAVQMVATASFALYWDHITIGVVVVVVVATQVAVAVAVSVVVVVAQSIGTQEALAV